MSPSSPLDSTTPGLALIRTPYSPRVKRRNSPVSHSPTPVCKGSLPSPVSIVRFSTVSFWSAYPKNQVRQSPLSVVVHVILSGQNINEVGCHQALLDFSDEPENWSVGASSMSIDSSHFGSRMLFRWVS